MDDPAQTDDFSSVLPGMKSTDDIDFTLEMGETGDDLSIDDSTLTSQDSGQRGSRTVRPFVGPLREILTECRNLGYGTPDLAFCVDTPDVTLVKLTLPEEEDHRPASRLARIWERTTDLGSRLTSKQKALTAVLRDTYDGAFDPERVLFVPMTRGETGPCFLAVVPTDEEASTPTLRALSATDDAIERAGRLLEAEVSLLTHIATTGTVPEPDENTAIVRVGTDDTLLLFLKGTELHHVERLRSVTSFDAAATISSRVLLHQDELKLKEVHHVLLVGSARNEQLLTSLASFYDEATTHTLPDLLQDGGLRVASGIDFSPASALAASAAQRLLHDPSHNLFGTQTRTLRKAPSMFAWHTAAVLLLLCAVSLGFGWRYMQQEQATADLERRLALSPVEMPDMTPAALKVRVDSLNAVHARHNRALYVLDSLLVGSDEWSRAIERTARETKRIEGIWFDNWRIDASTITIQGHALQRSNLASMARTLDGTIQELKFTDIQGVRAYPFTVSLKRSISLPEVTGKLREDALTPTLQSVSHETAFPGQ